MKIKDGNKCCDSEKRMTKLGTKQGFQRVAIILPLSETHHTGLKGASVNAWAVDKAKHGAEK